MKKYITLGLILSFATLSLAQLNGTYTIGGVNPDYSTIESASAAVKSLGISGPVVFNIRDGVYTEQVTFYKTSGADSINTVTYQSESLDSSKVTIQWTGQTLKLDSASYHNFKNLTFKSTSSTIGTVVKVLKETHHIRFENNHILGVPTQSAFDGRLIEYSTTDNGGYSTFKGNYFTGGTQALFLYGNTSPRARGNVVENNIFKNSTYAGILVQYQEDVIVRNNLVIVDDSTYSTYAGIKTNSCKKESQITGNEIRIQARYGIQLDNTDGVSSNLLLVANNMISVDISGGFGIGIYSNSSNYINYAYNSINVYNGTNGYGMYFKGGSLDDDNELKNNSIVNQSSGPALYIKSNDALKVSDHNNLYTGGNHLVVRLADSIVDLTTWQTTYNKDVNSVSVNPNYTSSTNLHTNSASLNGAGTPIAEVTLDFDGEARDQLNPDIGADEYDVITNIQNYSGNGKLKVYPNPTQGGVRIIGNSVAKQYTVFSMTGVEVLNGSFEGSSNKIDLSSLPAQLYIIKIGENMVKVSKVD